MLSFFSSDLTLVLELLEFPLLITVFRIIEPFLLSDGLECKVFIPGQQKEKTLKECTEWELLNLRIDDICSLTDDVIRCIKEKNPDFKIDVKVTVDKALEVKLSFL